MDQHKHNYAQKPLTWMIAATIVFFLGNGTVYLQEGTGETGGTDPNTAQPETNVVCQDEFQKFTDASMKEFRSWLETHFQNKSSTTSLLTDGIAKYEELQKTLLDELATYSPQQNALLLTETLETTACKKIATDALTEARRLLESKARSTSAVKRSTALLNKYQTINDKLSKLTNDYVFMKAYLDTFAAKLPCYIKRSCNKG